MSLYDLHADGTGCCFSSRLRPIVNMRPKYSLALIGGPHQFNADLHLVDWLETMGFAYDVITDEDLHAEGVDLIRAYRTLLFGTHPEYPTERMLDAIEAYTNGGGRLVYLGGNGFYWVTSVDPERPHLIEVRRGARGTGSWRSFPGEWHHATTGEPGGLWRDRGRAPQRYVGVGMTAMGFARALPFRREPGSHDARAAFIFEGIDDAEPIGAGGLVLDGAAGHELDRIDMSLGTPPHALLLATAAGFPDDYQHVVEEVEGSDSKQGGSVNPLVRADMTFYETPNGGAVFSAGSMCWCACLSANTYKNSVSQITRNVIERFIEPKPF
jgi:N,N-dimethylformamidase